MASINLKSYASNVKQAHRFFEEQESVERTPFQRDRDRIVHSTAFRRLTYKTQVFIYHEGDHYRTRLTHTLEVAQIARSIARILGIDEDLTEALALAHDLGHPPFGHAGENALNGMMASYGGFDHNAQSLRIVTQLEHRYADFSGLNLTLDCLDGLVKHNGPLTLRDGTPTGRYRDSGLPYAILAYPDFQKLELWSFPSLESQVASIADDIAYDVHDLDDGLRAGLLHLEDMKDVPLFGECIADVDARYPNLDPVKRSSESLRRLTTCLVRDLISEVGRRLIEDDPHDSDAVRYGSRSLVHFSAGIEEKEKKLKDYLKQNVYSHEHIVTVMDEASELVCDVFEHYVACPDSLPGTWRASVLTCSETERARLVCDFVAGMTDRFVLDEYKRLFGCIPELRYSG